MNCNITGKQFELTDALKESVHNALEYVERIYDDIIDTNVILSKENNDFVAEVIMNVVGDRLVIKSIDEDMYAAIADMGVRLGKVVRRRKEKKTKIDRKSIRDMGIETDLI